MMGVQSDHRGPVESPNVRRAAPSDGVVVEVSHLTVAYQAATVLRDINFQVQRGEFIAIIGPNGAGKSTLLRTIAGLIRPAQGTVAFRTHGAHATGGAIIGYVPQRFEIDPDLPLRVMDLVGLGWDGHRWGFSLSTRQRQLAVEDALAQVDALDYADAPAGRLSGGQLQRVLIAQALVSKPGLLLLDEPLSSLDLRSANAVVDVVDRVAHQNSVSVLLVTHDMNPLVHVMDQVMYVVNGQAVLGPVDQVVRKEVLQALYGHEVDVVRVGSRILIIADEVVASDR